MAKPQRTNCPLCGARLNEVQARNALSRADNQTYICSPCGNREALVNANPRRSCLYYDGSGPIMLVIYDEPGYEPFGIAPESAEFAQGYVDQWNAKSGVSGTEVANIVASSMFGRWRNF